MNKARFYTINLNLVQSWNSQILNRYFENTNSFSIPENPFIERINKISELIDSEKGGYPETEIRNKRIYLGTVLWLINNGHVAPDEYLNKAYTYALECYEWAPKHFLDELKKECFQEELAIITAQLQNKEPSLFKMTLWLSPFISQDYTSFVLNRAMSQADSNPEIRITLTKNRGD
jgi:hypothetical protein